MRFLFFLFFVFITLPCSTAWAQREAPDALADKLKTTNVTKLDAENFYKHCMAYPHPIEDEFGKQYFCSCASVNYYEKYKDIKVQGPSITRAGKSTSTQRDLVMSIYQPCMEIPITNFLTHECTSTSYLDDIPYINKSVYCACQRYRIPKLISESTKFLMAALRRSPEIAEDPLTGFLTSKSFTQDSLSISRICFDHATIDLGSPIPYVSKSSRTLNRSTSLIDIVRTPASSSRNNNSSLRNRE